MFAMLRIFVLLQGMRHAHRKQRMACAGPRFWNKCRGKTLTAAAAYGTDNMLFWTWTPNARTNTSPHLMEEDEDCEDRFDNLARDFDGVWKQLCDDIINGRFLPESLGHVKAEFWLRVKEFQKRSGNHGHGIAKFPGRPWTADIVRFTMNRLSAEDVPVLCHLKARA